MEEGFEEAMWRGYWKKDSSELSRTTMIGLIDNWCQHHLTSTDLTELQEKIDKMLSQRKDLILEGRKRQKGGVQ